MAEKMLRQYVERLQHKTWEEIDVEYHVHKIQTWIDECQRLKQQGATVDKEKLPGWAKQVTHRTSAYLMASQTPATRESIEILYRAYADRWAPILIRVCRQYTTEPEDLLGSVYDHFQRALSGYEKNRGELDAYLYYHLKLYLRRHAEKLDKKDYSLDQMQEEGYDPRATQNTKIDYQKWAYELSEDAGALYDTLTRKD